MIVTVTMNPAIDRTVWLDRLVPGGLNRIRRAQNDPGGKGINVSKTIRALGGDSVAAGFLAGESGCFIERALKEQGIRCDFVYVSGETRTNTKVIEENGAMTELNEPGPHIDKKELEELLQKLLGYAGPQTMFVLSGSVPAGVEKSIYADIVRMAREKGAKVLVDADGELFARAAAEGPDLVKPNREELARYAARLQAPETGETKAKRSGAQAAEAGKTETERSGTQSPGSGQTEAGRIGVQQLEAGEIETGRIKAQPPEAGQTEVQMWETAAALAARGIPRIAVSLGADGALFFMDGYRVKCPALPVKVCSALGAGDAMAAALALAWERKLGREDTIRLCMAASAGAVMTEGSQPPARETVEALLSAVVLR